MFTDIEGSTRLWDEHGDGMASALEQHDRLVREAIETLDGYVFATGGDGFCAAFDSADDAVSAAVATQRALADVNGSARIEVRVRMGLHTGVAQERDGDYFGPVVIRAARIMSVAHGGQILASTATTELMSSSAQSARPLGTVELSGFSDPEAVSQVVADGLVSEFPALRAADQRPGNLPVEREQLIGRDAAIDDLVAAVTGERITTLTGVGGVGKTSLALAAARRLCPGFADGAWFIELGKIHHEDDVPQAIAAALNIQPQVGLALQDAVIETLARQELLLVVDNCEHVLDGVSRLVDRLLDAATGVRVLATSREGLGVGGERIVSVASLATDGPDSPAVQLFVERAQSAGWDAAGGEGPALETLCRQLDGIPLAIELAAARANSLPPDQLLERLSDRFRVLSGRRRSTERHQTLRATVAWSYDLLEPDERRLFDRLSVFVGGFDLSAAEAVCSDGELDPLDAGDLLGALVDKSMVTADSGRFALLETLRQFGEEQLVENDDPDRFRRAHLEHFRGFVVAADEGLIGPDHGRWWAQLDRSWANVRAAFAYAHETGNTAAAIEISGHLWPAAAWHLTPEPFGWARAAMAMSDAASLPRYSSTVATAAFGAFTEGDLDEALRLAGIARAALGDESNDRWELIGNVIATVQLWRGDTDNAIEGYTSLSDRSARKGEAAMASVFQAAAAMAMASASRSHEAAACAREAQGVAGSTGNAPATSWALWSEGYALIEPDPEGAAAILERALAVAQEEKVTFFEGQCQRVLSEAYTRLGDHQRALLYATENLRICRRQGAWSHAWNQLFYTAWALEGLGEHEVAATLLGGVIASPAGRIGRIERLIADLQARIASSLGAEEAIRLQAEGPKLTAPEAASLADHASAPWMDRG